MKASLRFALVNLMKPHDIAVVAQVALALPNVEIFFVGRTLDFSHSKVVGKVSSWKIDPKELLTIKTHRVESLEELKNANRLVGLMPSNGKSMYQLSCEENDVYVLGGANGFSRRETDLFATTITIPCDKRVPFLTVSTVLPALAYQLYGM